MFKNVVVALTEMTNGCVSDEYTHVYFLPCYDSCIYDIKFNPVRWH